MKLQYWIGQIDKFDLQIDIPDMLFDRNKAITCFCVYECFEHLLRIANNYWCYKFFVGA